jgi:hypothetical protein
MQCPAMTLRLVVLSAVKVEPSGFGGPIRPEVCQAGGGPDGAGQERAGRSACFLFLFLVLCFAGFPVMALKQVELGWM